MPDDAITKSLVVDCNSAGHVVMHTNISASPTTCMHRRTLPPRCPTMSLSRIPDALCSLMQQSGGLKRHQKAHLLVAPLPDHLPVQDVRRPVLVDVAHAVAQRPQIAPLLAADLLEDLQGQVQAGSNCGSATLNLRRMQWLADAAHTKVTVTNPQQIRALTDNFAIFIYWPISHVL